MSGIPNYERYQIESLLAGGAAEVQRETSLFLGRDDESAMVLYEAAVRPALVKNGIGQMTQRVYDSDSSLAEVCRWALSAEVIIADVDRHCADLMYVLGLCHGLRRCPLLIYREPAELPFNLHALRSIGYRDGTNGMLALRNELTRAIRVFLTACRREFGG